MLTAITQIKPSLGNAISHDIAANGKAIAEVVDASMNETCMQELSKLILVASLADIPNALLGLSLQETIGYLCEPEKQITRVKKALDEFVMRAWYLYTDRDGRLFFKNTKNMIAELNSLIDSYDNDSAKKELRTFLEEKFKATTDHCYQKLQVFPAIDEISLVDDKVLLVLFEPYTGGNTLHPTLQAFYDDNRYKNRVMFLSGQRSTMDKLLKKAKEHRAINVIISRMDEEKVPANNPQYEKAVSKQSTIKLELLQAARETFMSLYYPSKTGLIKADFFMEFTDNNYNGEKQIKNVLLQRQKFTEEISGDKFKDKCEKRLFTQKEMRWNDVKERAATNPEWQWHHPKALDDLKNDMLKKAIWRENGGYIEKPPFPKEKTEVIFQKLRRDDETGEVTLRLLPKYGDRVHYEIGGIASTASNIVENLNEFKTNELKVSFLCIDTSGEHETGEPVEFKNDISVKYRIFDKGDDKVVELRAAPNVPIKYTTDGSNPKEHGGLYDSEIIVPKNATFVLAVAEENDLFSDVLNIKIEKTSEQTRSVDKQKPLKLYKRCMTSDTSETYKELSLMQKHKATISDVSVTLYKLDENNKEKGWVQLMVDSGTQVDISELEKSIDSVRSNLANEIDVNINLEYNMAKFETGQNFLDWVAEKKKVLKDFKEQEIVQ
jgi:hypothetical protein